MLDWKDVVRDVSLRVMSRGRQERTYQRGSGFGFKIRNFLIITMAETSKPLKPCIIVHGGAGNIPIARREQVLCAVKEAVKIGYRVLQEVRFTRLTRLYPEAVSFCS